MKKLVFVGPTLDASTVRDLAPGVDVQCPVGSGDIIAAVRAGYGLVAIVDGYFDQRQAVWHKEILWALTQGVLVYGASSLGALRASELAAFGMRGIGLIYELFHSRALERDDEVTIVHASASEGFRPLSVALVNIRFTLRAAVAEGAISCAFAEDFCRAAEDTFYPLRSYRTLLAQLRRAPRWQAEADSFAHWLGPRESRAVDQKQADARLLLEQLNRVDLRAEPPQFELAKTDAWHEFFRLHSGA